jgi:phasin family protein
MAKSTTIKGAAKTAGRQKAAPRAKAPKPVVSGVDAPARKDAATNQGCVTMTEETIKTAAADISEKATTMFHDMTAKAKAAFEKTGDISKEAVEFQKANLEAVVASGKAAAKGLQDVTQHNVELGKKSWEATTAHMKSLAGMQSPVDLMKAQTEFARGQFDAIVSDFSKSTEFYMKLAGEIAQPIQNRYAAATEQLKSRFAA